MPAAGSSLEYLLSLALPHGAWLSLAYTQADVGPVLQTASLTGPWGITFLVMGVPAALAVAARRGRRAGPGPVVAALVLALPLGYGTWRLRRPDPVPPPVSPWWTPTAPTTPSTWPPPPAGTSSTATSRGSALCPARRARWSSRRRRSSPTTDPAGHRRPDPRLAVEQRQSTSSSGWYSTAPGVLNAALGFRAHGGEPVLYLKHHLVPGAEEDLQPGDGWAFVPARPRPHHLLRPGLAGPGPRLPRPRRHPLLAPAWDFTEDALAAQQDGRHPRRRERPHRGTHIGAGTALTVSDPYGRVLAEARHRPGRLHHGPAALPAPAGATVYDRFGDWFAWACALALLAGTAVLTVTRRRVRADTAPASTDRPVLSRT